MSEWRVGHQGRDGMYYEERVNGSWQRIEVQGEMLTGRAHHVIYFASAADWQRYPVWARDRRDEIIARITSEFREPDYEYQMGTQATPPRPAPAAVRRPVQGMRALMLAIALLLAISGGAGWLVANGLSSAEVTLPMKRATLRRTVSRAEQPATYWLSIGGYSLLSLGTLAMAAWCMRERRRLLSGRS